MEEIGKKTPINFSVKFYVYLSLYNIFWDAPIYIFYSYFLLFISLLCVEARRKKPGIRYLNIKISLSLCTLYSIEKGIHSDISSIHLHLSM